jgi:hypothetical protein
MTRVLLMVCCAGVAATSGVTPSIPAHRLEFEGAGLGTWQAPLAEGESFAISFVHSQEKTLWIQHYRAAEDGTIAQTGSTFGSYGAGMPLEATRLTPLGFTVPLNRRFHAIQMRNSRDAQLTLHYRSHRYAIDQWFEPFAPFEIRVR